MAPERFQNTALPQKFRRHLQAQDWHKWDRYARRVRTLDLDDRRPTARRKVENSVFDEIARTRPREELLPNLHTIGWWTSSADQQARSILFMHSNIKSLSLRFHNSPTHPLATYVQAIVERVPHVTRLEVRADTAMHDLQTEMLSLMSRLHQLKELVVPMYFITSLAMSELALLPALESVEFAHPIEGGTGDRADVVEFNPALLDDAFPALKRLSFSSHLQHAVNFLNHPASPRNLVSIYLQVLAIDNPPILQHYFISVAHHLGRLTELYIDFLLGPDSPIVTPPPPPIARPCLETFRPLMSCRCLRRLELRWDYQLYIRESDLEELAMSWPFLELLLLNCDPIPEPEPPMLSPLALVFFAKHCLRLRELALYIDGCRVPTADLELVPPFVRLEKLSLGSSPIADEDAMALFLSQLCPIKCEVIAGVRWPDAYGIALDNAGVDEHIRSDMGEWWMKWTNVGKVLPLAIKARRHEKDRMSAVMSEVDRRNKDRLEELENELRELRGKMELGP
ncbi:hypothetical protein EIP86_008463 [Pleurotus ostreatoroseus]|nr:hypothetical protein EIP86_008463 [Pleurotus ostreatoroseus]